MFQLRDSQGLNRFRIKIHYYIEKTERLIQGGFVASHPYISGPGSVTQMIGFLRKNFPSTVTSETVKKFALAPNNESYVINALQFIGVLDEEGKRTSKGHDIFVLGDEAFANAFADLIKEAYRDLFELRGDDAWALNRSDLVSYFRTTDKTSEVIGGRQAGLFQAFRALAGYEQSNEKPSGNGSPRPRISKPKSAAQKKTKNTLTSAPEALVQRVDGNVRSGSNGDNATRRDLAMTVRIEINLPANGSQETYDAIFKSIRANLIDE